MKARKPDAAPWYWWLLLPLTLFPFVLPNLSPYLNGAKGKPHAYPYIVAQDVTGWRPYHRQLLQLHFDDSETCDPFGQEWYYRSGEAVHWVKW